MTENGAGRLFVVSTPIGNLGDITCRALEILEQADLIAAEDTRRTRILLNHYSITTRLTSYNSHNKMARGREIIRQLEEGRQVALVSDAGTPGVSDPLFHLLRDALEAGVRVEAAPGPSALLAALVVSGLPCDRFFFEGFLPRKKGRQTRLHWLSDLQCTVVLFESPQRIERTLQDIRKIFGNRRAVVAREMTKLHEETLRGTLDEMIAAHAGRKWKGEITLIVSGTVIEEGEPL